MRLFGVQDIANALAGMDPFVRRVFASSSYAPEDCWEALFLLSGGTKLDSFDSLSETARNVIVGACPLRVPVCTRLRRLCPGRRSRCGSSWLWP